MIYSAIPTPYPVIIPAGDGTPMTDTEMAVAINVLLVTLAILGWAINALVFNNVFDDAFRHKHSTAERRRAVVLTLFPWTLTLFFGFWGLVGWVKQNWEGGDRC